MSNEARQRDDELISRYMDGLMEEAERAAFVARLAREDDLRREVALAGVVDGALKRVFGAPPVIGLPARGDVGEKSARPESVHERTAAPPSPGASPAASRGTAREKSRLEAGGPRKGRWVAWGSLAAAAVVAMATFIGFQAGVFSPSHAAALYASKEADGFSYVWACESDAAFIEHTTVAFSQPLVADSTETAQIVGWDYVPESWDPDLGLLVAKVEGRDVLVVIEPAVCRGGGVELKGGSGLNVFSQRVGDVMVHEITPLDRAVAVGLLRVP